MWKSDFPNAQPVLVHVDRWMEYDDHYMKWSRVQQRKTIGMEGGMSVPATMNLTEYRQLYFQARNLEPNFQLWTGRGEGLLVMGVLTLGPGLISLPS